MLRMLQKERSYRKESQNELAFLKSCHLKHSWNWAGRQTLPRYRGSSSGHAQKEASLKECSSIMQSIGRILGVLVQSHSTVAE